MALIPKFPETERIADYRSIALGNFQFKIISKVLAEMLAFIAPKIIYVQQRGFTKGTHIEEYIYTTSEAINLLDCKSFGGKVALNFDIKKAYDTLDWKFLLKVLNAFGFHSKFSNWIWTILNSTRLSFIVNGHSAGYLSCRRGVRQGDPLFPLLFCLAKNVLSRSISYLEENKMLHPMAGARRFQM